MIRGVNGKVQPGAGKGVKADSRQPNVQPIRALGTLVALVPIASWGLAPLAQAQAPPPALRVVVNSNQDGPVKADGGLTLREAIEVVNGTLPLNQLSSAEQAQVTPLPGVTASRIEFALPADQTTIQLGEILPDLTRSGLVIDGTTQPGYEANRSAINELAMPIPRVSLTPAPGAEVFRGLTVTADNVTIRGLSLYGFNARPGVTASTPPADIFISHRLPPPDIRKQPTPANFSPFYADDVPPKGVVIENNWLGLPPSADGSVQPDTRSAFGVSVFNGMGTIVRRNWIANHEGSALITAVNAENLQVTENVITGNGVAGMPDAIRLEGNINQTQVKGNLICANDGSGVYLFKPQGAAQIQANQIVFNGRRLRRAAVYLMGSHHQVTDNEIRYQAGPGVVVAAYPTSTDNQIQGNRFSHLEGLSVDLVTRNDGDVYAYQRGDGLNPRRTSPQRRKDTGNGAIDPPQFVAKTFFVLDPGASSPELTDIPVEVFGTAEPGSKVEIYRVAGPSEALGALDQPIATVDTDAQGKFSLALKGLRVGERISAIATHPQYGSSEPSDIAVIGSLNPNAAPSPTPQSPTSLPRCTTPVAEQPPVPTPTPPAPIRLRVPKVIHFALDQDFISPASAKVLDRIAQVLRENPFVVVDLVGHTDPRASDAYNLALGKRRALSARNYLLRRGIAAARMTLRSEGERSLISQGTTRLDYARDRRVEFIYKDIRDIEVIVQEQDLQLEP